MRNLLKKSAVMGLAAPLLLSGCGALNPYHKTTMCPSLNDFGECVSMPEAYEATLETPSAQGRPGEGKTTPASNEASPEIDYRTQYYREMASLIREPTTPLVKPPTVRRVLITSYEDGALFMPRYLYLMIDGPEWVLAEPRPSPGGDTAIELFRQTEK